MACLYRDRAQLSPTHTGGENNSSLSADFVLCEGACLFYLLTDNKKYPKAAAWWDALTTG